MTVAQDSGGAKIQPAFEADCFEFLFEICFGSVVLPISL